MVNLSVINTLRIFLLLLKNISYFSKFKISVPPQIMPFTFGDELFNSGDSTGVSCIIIKGDLPIQIKWTLNNEPIVSGENGITINKLSAKSSVLNIASVDREHRGTIKCIAENMAGSDTYSSELSVNGTNLHTNRSIIK